MWGRMMTYMFQGFLKALTILILQQERRNNCSFLAHPFSVKIEGVSSWKKL